MMEEQMKKLAIFFPGIGYHCDKPLLYYARKLTQECGYEECISLSYSYDGRNIRGDEQKMQQAFEALYAQAEQQLSKVDFGKYSEILFVSKSVGTIIASNYAWKYKIPSRQILYTPLKQTYAFPHENAIAFIGCLQCWKAEQALFLLLYNHSAPHSHFSHSHHYPAVPPQAMIL